MSRVKQILSTGFAILILVSCVGAFIAGGISGITKPRECAKHYPECAQEKIETVLAASESYLYWMEGPSIRISSVRAASQAISGAASDLRKVKAPAPYEAIHVKLVEAMERMDELTDIVAPPLNYDNHAVFYAGLKRNIPDCQETLRQIQSDIVQLSGGRVETPSAAGSPPATLTPATAAPCPTVITHTVTSSSTTITYTVRSGDTLAKIAASFNVTVGALLEANDIKDLSLINAGQVLVIPHP